MQSYDMWPSVSGYFHFVLFSRFIHITNESLLHLFYGQVIFNYTVNPQISSPLISSWLLWTTVYKFTRGHVFIQPSGGVSRSYGNSFWGIVRLFSKRLLHSFQSYMKVLISPHPHHYLLWDVFWSGHPCGYKLVTYCAFGFHSIMTNDVHLSCIYWPSVYLLWKVPIHILWAF